MLEISGYDNDDDGSENRICFWLRLDNWSLVQASMLIINLDPDKTFFNKKDFNFSSLRTLTGEDYPEIDSNGFPIVEAEDDMDNQYFIGSDKLEKYTKNYHDLHRIFTNSDCEEYMPPLYWVNKALSKRINVLWLNFAIKFRFFEYCTDINGNSYLTYVNDLEILENEKNESQIMETKIDDVTSQNYPIELKFAIQAWQAVSTSEGKGKPKARIKKWLNENTELSNEAKERIATVANWDKTGGATKT